MTRAQRVHAGLVLLPLAAGLTVAILAMAGIAWAGSSDGTTLDWSVLGGAGAPASGGAVTLNGTLGQTAIGASTGTGATLGAGFWYGLGEGAYEIYLPVTLRNYH